MSESPHSQLYRFVSGRLEASDHCDPTETRVLVADSWLVEQGRTLAWPLHRGRFSDSVRDVAPDRSDELERFLSAVVAAIPSEGAWFPRVELQHRRGTESFVYRERSAPPRQRTVRLATLASADPRTRPRVKGPDLERLLAARTSVQAVGADEAVILSADGYVVEGAYSSLMWWRGDALCLPDPDLARIDGVTARTAVALATARGTDVVYEAVPPAALDGLEVWATSALHGIRIAIEWIDGPNLAERPGRLSAWRAALDKLTRPMVTLGA